MATNILKDIPHFLLMNSWVIEIVIVALLTWVLSHLESRFYRRFYSKLKRAQRYKEAIFLQSLHHPLHVLIIFLGIAFIGQIMAANLKPTVLLKAISPMQSLGIILLIIWWILRLIRRLEQHVVNKDRKADEDFVDPTTVQALSRLVQVAVFITAFLMVLQTLGVPISGVLAFGGVGGLAVGFAAKDLLANFFGTLMIFLDRPFKVGDWIRSPDKQIEGVVEYISWRLTRIRTFDKRPLYVPNAVFLNIALENPERMQNRRIKKLVGLRYDDAHKVEAILTDIESMLRHHPDIDARQILFAKFVEFGASSLNILIYTFTKTINWVEFQSVQQAILLKVLAIIEAHGAECAFPTSTVHIHRE